MSRQKKDPIVLAHMCARLAAVMDLLGMSDARVSEELGYTSQATLSQVRRGMTFPDVEKLACFARLAVGNAAPNLHWVLTGTGAPFVHSEGLSTADRARVEALNSVAMMKYEDSGLLHASERL